MHNILYVVNTIPSHNTTSLFLQWHYVISKSCQLDRGSIDIHYRDVFSSVGFENSSSEVLKQEGEIASSLWKPRIAIMRPKWTFAPFAQNK